MAAPETSPGGARPIQPEKLIVLGRTAQGFHILVNYRPALELVTFDAIRSDHYDEVDLRWSEENRVKTAIYAARVFGITREDQHVTAVEEFGQQGRKIGYTIFKNRVFDLGEVTAARRRH